MRPFAPCPHAVAVIWPRQVGKHAFSHFAQRCSERFGMPWRQAWGFWCDLRVAFEAEDWGALRLVVRVSRRGRRVFLARLHDGRFVFVLIDCAGRVPITVFTEGMCIRTEGKGLFRLEVPHDLRG